MTSRENTGRELLTISAKPDGVGAASQRLIPTGERSGLLTGIVTTENGSLCEGTKADCACGTQSDALEATANETVSTERQAL